MLNASISEIRDAQAGPVQHVEPASAQLRLVFAFGEGLCLPDIGPRLHRGFVVGLRDYPTRTVDSGVVDVLDVRLDPCRCEQILDVPAVEQAWGVDVRRPRRSQRSTSTS